VAPCSRHAATKPEAKPVSAALDTISATRSFFAGASASASARPRSAPVGPSVHARVEIRIDCGSPARGRRAGCRASARPRRPAAGEVALVPPHSAPAKLAAESIAAANSAGDSPCVDTRTHSIGGRPTRRGS
jgi:hypothetical protein